MSSRIYFYFLFFYFTKVVSAGENYCLSYLVRFHTALLIAQDELPLVVSEQARKDLIQDRLHQAELEKSREEAWKKFPFDPLRRARYLNENLPKSKIQWNAALKLDPYNRPMLEGDGGSRELIAFPHQGMNTLIIRSNNGNSPENSEVIVVALHGMGGSASHSERVLRIVRELTTRRETAIKQNPSSMPRIYAEALDLPYSGSGPNSPEFMSLDKTADWLAIRLRELQSSGKPIVLFARSASVALATRLNERHPTLVDGFLMMSGNYPSFDLILQVDEVISGRHRKDPSRPLNWKALVASSHWEYDLASTMPTQDPFGEKPKLLWIGGKDEQLPPAAVTRWKNLIGSSDIIYVPEAGHDLMPFHGNLSGTTQRFNEAYNKVIFKVISEKKK